jgi:hypothetical protein
VNNLGRCAKVFLTLPFVLVVAFGGGCRRHHGEILQRGQVGTTAPIAPGVAARRLPMGGAADGAARRSDVPEAPFELFAPKTGAAPRWTGDEPQIRVDREGVLLRTDRGLERLPSEGGEATLVVDDPRVDAFERDDKNLYWIHLTSAKSWELMRADSSGHLIARLGSGTGAPPVPLAIDDDRIYVGGSCAAQTIYVIPKKGGPATALRASCDFSSGDEQDRYQQLSALRGAVAWIVPANGVTPCLVLLRPDSPSRVVRCMSFDALTAYGASFYSTRGADWTTGGRVFRWGETRAESPDVLVSGASNLYYYQIAADGDDVYLAATPDEPSAGEIWRVNVPSKCDAFLATVPLGTRIAARDGQVYALLKNGDVYRAPRAPFGGCRPSTHSDPPVPGNGTPFNR